MSTIQAQNSWSNANGSNEFTTQTPIYTPDGVLLNPATAVLSDGPKPSNQTEFKLLNTTPFGFGDDFEDGDISDWTDNLGSNTAALDGTDPGEGGLSLQITGSANNFNNGLRNTTSTVVQPTSISFRVKATNANANHNYVIISEGTYSGASTNSQVMLFFFWSDNDLAWRLVNDQN
ncbi:MAG: carbohydrate binding domain-containing protein, partial [Bacteroidota bacterium]